MIEKRIKPVLFKLVCVIDHIAGATQLADENGVSQALGGMQFGIRFGKFDREICSAVMCHRTFRHVPVRQLRRAPYKSNARPLTHTTYGYPIGLNQRVTIY